MSARIYVIPLSNPAAAGFAMVAHKRLPTGWSGPVPRTSALGDLP